MRSVHMPAIMDEADNIASHPPDISISRASTASHASGDQTEHHSAQNTSRPPKVNTVPNLSNHWNGNQHRAWQRHRGHSPGPEWHIKWTPGCFPNGRILIIDYISNEAVHNDKCQSPGKRHIAVAAAEFEDLAALKTFYANSRRAHSAALRVIHVQNATWATQFLLKKFNIEHPSEVVGMQGFATWASYEKPRQRNGRPFPNGRSFREQTDPWRNVCRTAFGLDYLKTYPKVPPNRRGRRGVLADNAVNAKLMQLNAYDDSKSPFGYDVSVQRLSVYVQRNLGPKVQVSPELEARNPYRKQVFNGDGASGGDDEEVDLQTLDNSNTVIVFETSASMMMGDCLVQPRNEIESRWRRLSFYLRKEEALNDARLAAQCTNMILSDVFHGLAIVWEGFLTVAIDHVNMLEDKIYENPADESRAPELWTNQAAWLKVDKVMYIHQDLVREMQSHMRELADADEDEPPIPQPDWLASTPFEYEKLGHSVQEDLVQATANLSDLMYKSVGIRDSRQSLQLGLSMWRLSWITFIFLPLTFVVSFFGMNVGLFENNPGIAWFFIAAGVLMVFVLLLWYCVKHSLQRIRQTPYQRGLYEHLFSRLQDEYPILWTNTGAVDSVEPTGILNRLKWNLLKRWFAPDKTIDKKLYSSLAPDGDNLELGAWARFKRALLIRWLPQILRDSKPTDAIAMAEVGVSRPSMHDDLVAINSLTKITTPIAMAETEPSAAQTVATFGLRPMSFVGYSPRQSSVDRPSSCGSSGIMVEERNLSDSESEAGEGAYERVVRVRRASG